MILEREFELDALTGVLESLEDAGGKVVLVRGEAGIGKTALISCFVDAAGHVAHVLTGGCDDLLTPQPLSPFWDVARMDASIAEPLASGDRWAVMGRLLDLLSREARPTVLVLEDMQWADEATLDVVTYLGRRITRANAMIVLSYRDGEVDRDHPLRQVIGGLPAQALLRLPLSRLSAEAVASLLPRDLVDVEEVLALTGGNPLFVAEVLASGVEVVPSSVRDSVLARVARCSPSAVRALELVSVVPGGLEHALVELLLGPEAEGLDECVAGALLQRTQLHVSFPHELQRRAVESSLSPEDRVRWNQRVLAALAGRGEPARLVHHARQAEDRAATVLYGPLAARAAMTSGSHREAVAHFRALEPHLDAFPPAELAAILHDWATQEAHVGSPDAVALLDRAVSLRRSLGDEVALATTLTFGVRVNEVHGRPDVADAYAREAVAILETGPCTAAQAAALSQLGWLHLMRDVAGREGVQIADRAIQIAEAVGDDRTAAAALILKGSLQHVEDMQVGFSLVEEGHLRALRGGHRFEEVYALILLAGLCGDQRDVARAADFARRARETAVRYELHALEMHAQAMYAEILLWQGKWAEAEDAAAAVLGTDPHVDAIACRVIGLLEARGGRAAATRTLKRMWSLAADSEELMLADPAAAALAEHLWLTDDHDPQSVLLIQQVADRGERSGSPWPSAALTFWMWELGLDPVLPPGMPAFYRLIVDGDVAAAERFWQARGVPYEQALASMHGDVPARIRALRLLDDLGAAAPANRVRRALIADGVRVPRGRSRAARDHVAGLTGRQAEVLDLLAEGITNGEIADRLFVSHRTVENHVAAVLRKLDASTRVAAVRTARERGLLTGS